MGDDDAITWLHYDRVMTLSHDYTLEWWRYHMTIYTTLEWVMAASHDYALEW